MSLSPPCIRSWQSVEAPRALQSSWYIRGATLAVCSLLAHAYERNVHLHKRSYSGQREESASSRHEHQLTSGVGQLPRECASPTDRLLIIILFVLQLIKSQPVWTTSNCGSNVSKMIENIWAGRESSTVNSYCSSIRKFLIYAKSDKNIQLPLSSAIVGEYLTYLSLNKASKTAISSSLAALKWLNSFIPGVNKWSNPLNDEFLGKIVSGINRQCLTGKQQKLPLTGEMVLKITEKAKLDDLKELRDCLAIAFAYNLLLRYDELSHISCNHLTKLPNGYKILIPKSKTDKFRNGKHVFLSHSHEAFSTYHMLERYLNLSRLEPGQNHFLFCPLSKTLNCYALANKILSYTSFRDIVKNRVKSLGLDCQKYGTHSCRSGGATDLAPHVSEHDLLVTGRWADARSIRSYVEMPEQSRFRISSILQTNLTSESTENESE